MKNLNVLITAGPTREYIDPIRYLSNDSSGKTGFALAAAAKKLGANVTLVAGPVSLETPKGVKRVNVVNADEMRQEVMKRQGKSDIIIMAAAVSDFKPSRMSKHKIKRTTLRSHDLTTSRPHDLTISLKENPDILAELGKKKRPNQLLIGFAVETQNLEGYARRKLKQKNCDWIVANRHTVIGKEKGRAILLSKQGKRIVLPKLPKNDLAILLLSHILGKEK